MTGARRRVLIIIGCIVLAYVGLVTAFELSIGLRQPESGGTLVIHTTKEDGSAHRRVLARLQDGDQLYVAVNHWPRAWYRQALANPEVQVELDGEMRAYRAVPVSEEEHARLEERFPISFGGRFMMGFPPRHFLRLEPDATVRF